MAIEHSPNAIPLRVPFAPGRGFNYAKPIRITNRTTQLTDYQIEVNLNQSNFDFNKVQADGADIRFQDANGKSLNYWIETWNSITQTSRIWVHMPRIENQEDRIIWLIYGNEYAKSNSDGSKTFYLFDHFTTYSGWTEEVWTYAGGTWNFSQSGTELRLYCANSGGFGRRTRKTINVPSGTYYQRNRYRIVTSECNVNFHTFRVDSPNQRSNEAVPSTTNDFSLGSGTSFDVFIGDINYGSTGASDHYVDWILVHKVATPAPTIEVL